MNKFTATDKFLMIGLSGSGKSYLCKALQKEYPRRVIFDSMDEYELENNKNSVMVHSFEELVNTISNFRDEKRFQIIYRIDTSDPNSVLYFENALYILYELGNVCVVVEEAQDYCTPNKIPASYKKCMTSGRHRNMAFFATTQRPSIINGMIFSQSTQIFCGNLIKKSDAQTMADLLNIPRIDINQLEKRRFFWFNINNPREITKINTEKTSLIK